MPLGGSIWEGGNGDRRCSRLPLPHRRRRVLRDRRRDQTRQGGIRRLSGRRGRRRRGGTWYWNTYPGIAVDIPSFSYQFSFEQRPDWSRTYAPGNELKAYAEHCVDKYGIRPKIRFNTKVLAAGVRRRAVAMAGANRSRGRGHRPIPDQRQRRADRAQAARHRRRRLLRRHHHAHRALGPHPRPDRQTGRDHRHRRLGRAADPRDRADRQRAHGVSAHADLVLPEVRRAAAGRPALALRLPGGKAFTG